MQRFHLLDRLIVRAPTLPLATVSEATARRMADEHLLSLYYASHSLYSEVAQTSNAFTDSIALALVRYNVRMCTRSVPFGWFAGCGISKNLRPVRIRQDRVHTRLDYLVLHQLAQRIGEIPAVRSSLRYFTNTSLYQISDELRFVQYNLAPRKRTYRSTSAIVTEGIDEILRTAQNGIDYLALVQSIAVRFKISEDQAQDYANSLIDNQLLYHELEPTIIGKDFVERLVSFVQRLPNYITTDTAVNELIDTVHELNDKLYCINIGQTTILEQGPTVVSLLKPYVPNVQESRLFQVDSILSVTSNKDSATLIENKPFLKAISVLSKIADAESPNRLTYFTEQFIQRFGDQEVKLSLALDTQDGIDYLDQSSQIVSPLLKELSANEPVPQLTLTRNAIQRFKWELLQRALYQGDYQVTLTDAMVSDFDDSDINLPPSFSVIFQKIENNQLYFEKVGGESAVNLVNRFSYADLAIYELVQDIVDQEQYQNSDVILAEIIHLPESRLGNVTFHPPSKKFEIPYLAAPSVSTDFQLPLSDLYVSVKNNKVLLRSKRHNKRVIPRLSTAHNYHQSDVPVYRFLGDLQSQGLQTSLTFHWGVMSHHFPFLPRVVYKKAILHPATWQLNQVDLQSLKEAEERGEFLSEFGSFKKHWKLPQQFVLADGDNELYVDSEKSLLVNAWWDLVKKRSAVVLKEFFMPSDAVTNDAGEIHVHQLLAVLVKQEATYKGTNTKPPSMVEVPRYFMPGSEWLCYKVYCGIATSDRILEEVLAPLINQLSEASRIDQWFFIRYADPDNHLRVRLHLQNQGYLSEVMHKVEKSLRDTLKAGMISLLQIDTYSRELERYGGATIIETEVLFYHDSEATLQFLSLTEGDEREDLRWLWGLRSINELLNDFQLATSEKLTLLQRMKERFAHEFGVDKPLKLQLDKKYRTHRAAINDMLALQDPSDEFYPLVEVLQTRSARHASAVTTLLEAQRTGKLSLSLTDLLQSYIHMSVNRLIPSQARFHELVLYDFLYRQYRSEVARSQKEKATG